MGFPLFAWIAPLTSKMQPRVKARQILDLSTGNGRTIRKGGETVTAGPGKERSSRNPQESARLLSARISSEFGKPVPSSPLRGGALFF